MQTSPCHRSATFTYNCTDGSLSSQTATATVSVTAVPDRPLANDIAVSVGVNGTANFTLAGSTVDGCVLSFRVDSESVWNGTAMNVTPKADTYALGSETLSLVAVPNVEGEPYAIYTCVQY
jgi:hypothetical protein